MLKSEEHPHNVNVQSHLSEFPKPYSEANYCLENIILYRVYIIKV